MLQAGGGATCWRDTSAPRPLRLHLPVSAGTQIVSANIASRKHVLKELTLDRRLRLGLDEMGLETATEVQSTTIPIALAGSDVLVNAETGSGKTLAYLVPAAQKILAVEDKQGSGTLLLVLVPTRELARQVLKTARVLLAKSPVQAQAITGGADSKYQRAMLRKDPEILVATPGRLLELSRQGHVHLGALQTLVLDEADRMLDMGFRDDVLELVESCNRERQIMLLSATLKHAGVAAIARDILREPRNISVGLVRQAHSAIFHQRILADSQEHKDKLLHALLEQGGFKRALVFANKRSSAARLQGMLSHFGMRCGCLHGELTTEERKHVVQQFQDGKIDILCASDVAARGLDVSDIGLVVNFDLPRSGDDYLHRTGRTGRAGNTGLAVSLVSASEWNLMISIQRYVNVEFEKRALPGLKARFSGPKKTKSSGKAAGSKKKKSQKTEDKSRSRKRNQKSTGKRREPAKKKQTGNDGFAPLMKKKPAE